MGTKSSEWITAFLSLACGGAWDGVDDADTHDLSRPEVAIYVRPDLGGQRLKVGACYRHPPDLEATGSPGGAIPASLRLVNGDRRTF